MAEHVHQCRKCDVDTFPPEDGPRIDEHHVNFQRKRSWEDLLSEVYINGKQQMCVFQAYDGEVSWALRLSPPFETFQLSSGQGRGLSPHRCSCGSGKPCIEMVYGGVTIKRPTPAEIAEAQRVLAR